MTAFTFPSISRTGRRLRIYFADKSVVDGTENPLKVTAINSTPSAKQNGVSITLPAPTWASNVTNNSGQKIALISYWLPNATPGTVAAPGDVWTFTASSGWATVGGLSAPASAAQAVVNNTGLTIEPEFILPTLTLPLGCPTQWPVQGKPYGEYHAAANLAKCFTLRSANVTSMDASGYPLTINGAVSSTIVGTTNSNWVDGKGMPSSNGPGNQMGVGTYRLRVDERNPASPMTITVTASNNWTVSAVTVLRGVVVNGVEVGKTFEWTVQRKTPTAWNLALTLKVSPPSGGTSWTIAPNWCLLRPGADSFAAVGSNTDLAPSENILNLLTAPNGRVPYVIRHGDDTADYDASSNVVDAGDSLPASAWSWNGFPQRLATVTTIRPPTFPLVVYLQDSYGGIGTASPPGSPGPYQVTVATVDALNVSTSNGLFEVVFSGPHGFKSGQYPTSPQKSQFDLSGIQFTNSLSSTLTTGNLNNNRQIILVTGANTVLQQVFSSGFTAGGFAICTSSQAAGGDYALNLPDNGSWPVEAACQFNQALGSNAWQTLPLFGTPAQFTDWATRCLANHTAGKLFLFTPGNEVWASQEQGIAATKMMSQLGGNANAYDFYAKQCLSAWNAFHAVWNTAGRASELRLIVGSQYANSGVTSSIGDAMSANGVHPHFVVLAPYPDMDRSPSMLLSNTWPVADMVDLARDCVWANTVNRGSLSFWAQHIASIASHFTGGPLPALGVYEIAYNTIVSYSGSANQTIYNLTHDCGSHPYFYDAVNQLWLLAQTAGVAFANMSSLIMPYGSGVSPWPLAQWEGQQPGYGDGRSGSTLNQYATAQGGSPADGASHIGPDAVNPNGNVSPALQAFLDWVSVTGLTPTPTPTPTPVPTVTRWFPGLRRL